MTSYDIFALTIIAFVFLIGAIFGSFLNVVILRAFSGESIVLPPSKCPKCGNRLKWWHNIPILSFILLRGKCYFCHEKISIQYPIIEFITGVLFVIAFFVYGLQLDTIFAFIILPPASFHCQNIDCVLRNLPLFALIDVIAHRCRGTVHRIMPGAS